ncbi:MAG: peroxiredoxin family protein [Chitinophagaceae bacterium]
MQRLTLLLLLLTQLGAHAQVKKELYKGIWKAQLKRQDGELVVFNFETKKLEKRWQLIIRNASERIVVNDVTVKGDSVNFVMPFFESEFRTQVQRDGSLKGIWFKGTALQTQQWEFIALPNHVVRFESVQGKELNNITGRWAVSIARPNGTIRPAVAEFVQKGNYLSGTFLAPSGDYRYLEGIVTGNLLRLSVFDGSHSYLFTATIDNNQKISNGIFYSGFNGKENWTAIKDATAQLPDVGNAPQLKEGEDRIRFSFKDINRNIISSSDDRFKNKVMIVQLMGSWCPNCMDETKFLNELYINNKQRGLEVVALAYENSTDFERSRTSLLKFQQRFNVQYPMLITGVWVNDSLRTEKTLPQLTAIKVFPTTIFIGKDGKIRKFHAGFFGPGTGEYFELLKKEFYQTLDDLLNEK